MLILTRRPGQSVSIGDGIEVIVVEVRGEQVRLGIKAPRDVPVVRGEIRELSEAGEPDPAPDSVP